MSLREQLVGPVHHPGLPRSSDPASGRREPRAVRRRSKRIANPIQAEPEPPHELLCMHPELLFL